MRSLLPIAKYALAIVLTLYFIKYAVSVVQSNDPGNLSVMPDATSFLISVFLYVMIIPVSAFAWHRILGDLGESWSIWRLNCIVGSTQFAKYIPGNIAQHIARVSLAVRYGMRMGVFTTSVIVETTLAIFACLAVGCILALGNPTIWSVVASQTTSITFHPAMFIVTTIAISVSFIKPVRNKLYEWSARCLTAVGAIRPSTLLTAFLAYSMNYLIIGLGLYVIARSMDIASALNYSVLTAAFAWAWVIGFFAPGAPAGLGVREGILVLIFNQFSDEASVLALVIVLRFVTLIGDLVWFLVSIFALNLKAQRQSNA